MNLNPFHWFKKDAETIILREAVGVTIDDDDAEWRPLSGDGSRDLTPMTQRRMQDLAVYLWESNLLANRLIELPVAYLLAEGVTLQAGDDLVQEQIDRFWADPINQMDLKLIKKVRELALYGEQCWPTFVNRFNGTVRLGYLDPIHIETVVLDPDNGEQPIGVVTVKNRKGVSRRYRVIVNGPEEELFTRKTQQIRQSFDDGECFYFAVNQLSNGRRGRSDLLPQADWVDIYEQFLFGESERSQFLRAFIWDVKLMNATSDEVKKRAREITAPKPGGVRVHNDAEEWNAVTPGLNASDSAENAKLFRNHILGGATIPEHWYGGASDVNRATGESMGEPTFKLMSLRQQFIGHILCEMGKYVIRQWELAHNGREPDLFDPVYDLSAQFPEMVARDTTKYAAALTQVTMAVSQAIDRGLLSKERGLQIIESVAGRLGVPFDAAEELENVQAELAGQPMDEETFDIQDDDDE